MTFCVVTQIGDEFRFEMPCKDWFKEHEWQELTLWHNVDAESDAAGGNINCLILKYLPKSLQKRFAKSFKRRYLVLFSKFIHGDLGIIVKDEFILILISNTEVILRELVTVEFARQREKPPYYLPLIWSGRFVPNSQEDSPKKHSESPALWELKNLSKSFPAP